MKAICLVCMVFVLGFATGCNRSPQPTQQQASAEARSDDATAYVGKWQRVGQSRQKLVITPDGQEYILAWNNEPIGKVITNKIVLQWKSGKLTTTDNEIIKVDSNGKLLFNGREYEREL